MTRFASPALHQPDLHLPVSAVRAALGAAAVLFTAAVWFAAGSQAGQFGHRDITPRVELEPVVVSGHRGLPEHQAVAMRAAAGADCGTTSAARSTNRVTLEQ